MKDVKGREEVFKYITSCCKEERNNLFSVAMVNGIMGNELTPQKGRNLGHSLGKTRLVRLAKHGTDHTWGGPSSTPRGLQGQMRGQMSEITKREEKELKEPTEITPRSHPSATTHHPSCGWTPRGEKAPHLSNRKAASGSLSYVT